MDVGELSSDASIDTSVAVVVAAVAVAEVGDKVSLDDSALAVSKF